MKVVNLQVKNQENPINIGPDGPDFSWNVETDLCEWTQTAWQLTVEAAENETLIWDSKKHFSSQMVHIPYEGEELQPDCQYRFFVQVWGQGKKHPGDSRIISEYARGEGSFQTALFTDTDWHGRWIGENQDHVYHIFRKTITIKSPVSRASLFICGLGHYEFYINGSRLEERVLEPGWTDYHKHCLYSCYDVTRKLLPGQNGLGLILGDGMFNVPEGGYVYFPRSYGKCKFLLQMNIEYKNGGREEIVSDPSWYMAPSALTFSSIYGGEDFDARMKQKGFSRGDYKPDNSWQPAVLVPPPKGRLIPEQIPPLKVMEHYSPVSCRRVGTGQYLLDFGTNFSGWIQARLSACRPVPGHTVRFIPGEILDNSNMPDQRVTGQGYHWTYIMDDDLVQDYHPRFTYTGFRYVLVEGAVPGWLSDGPWKEEEHLPVLEAVTGEFIYPKDIQRGTFWCDNPLFNKIHRIICQAILSNTKSIFTDCPHREKLGWLEQTHLIGPSIMYDYNVSSLYEKIQQDMADAQSPEGCVPDICPRYIVFGYHEGFNDSPEWGSAVVLNPWYMYKRYGDEGILKKYYPVMKKYTDYLTLKSHDDILNYGLGDWLDIGPMTPYSQNTPVAVVATNIYYYDLTVMENVARILGKDQDASTYASRRVAIYESYQRLFFDDQTGRYANGSQAAQAMSLVTGLAFKGREKDVLKMLVTDIEKRDYQTTAGDIGHPFVLAALKMYGRNDVIDRMACVTSHPGYGYQVACGATTLTEEWDGPDPEHPHGSQNHLMLGSMEEWFYSGLAGILDLREQDTFDRIYIHPYFSQSCDRVEASVAHPHGMIRLKWERKENKIFMDLALPPNTSAAFFNDLTRKKILLGSGWHHFSFDLK